MTTTIRITQQNIRGKGRGNSSQVWYLFLENSLMYSTEQINKEIGELLIQFFRLEVQVDEVTEYGSFVEYEKELILQD